MARVTRINGKVVFDIVTEDCLDNETIDNWLTSIHAEWANSSLFPKQTAINFS